MHSSRYRIFALCLTFAGLAIMLMNGASAAALDEIPESLAESLGLSTYAAKLLLSCAILLAVGLCLAISKSENVLVTVIVLLGFVGFLTVIQWLDAWLLIFIAVILALQFGGKMRDWASSKAGGG